MLKSITLRMISAPLKQPFYNALGTLTEREAIIIEVKDQNGISGWGEVVAFSSPWYTEETIKTCYYVLKEYLIPALHQELKHPHNLQKIFATVRGHYMAKSGLECAFWDLYSKQQKQPLYKLFGGSREEVEAGVVIASNDVKKALQQIEVYQAEGYKRYKVKVSPHNAIEYISAIRKEYEDLPLMVDANSSFALDNQELFRRLDDFHLMMIEQPLEHDDLLLHSELQKQLKTPICLDESITSFNMAKNAIALQSAKILCVKMGRVGGWSQALAIHNYSMQHDIPLWCGGMIEFGISRAHNLALATLDGFTIPGDISSSSRFWEEDIVEPELTVVNGKVKVSAEIGIGCQINWTVLNKLTNYIETFPLK
ncbi:o-succinylbenzoate synthase [Bacillus massiliigorillae]|uniref:o-succinylbenzoate synthase n=1 Tax=Bacillus massiliigorillae TaxID=1243664 RepID=UPI0003A754A5|nr:o-succinylbenzoate synthase [Bacillus massiliigorillae]